MSGRLNNLLAQAAVIRDATEEHENTAVRVGTMFVDFIQACLAVLPSEIIDAAGITASTSETNFVVSYRVSNEEGNTSNRSITIPAASSENAGLLTPELLRQVNSATSSISNVLTQLSTKADIIDVNAALADVEDDVAVMEASLRAESNLTPLSTLASQYIGSSGNIVEGGAYDVEVYAVEQGDVIQLTFSGYDGIGSGTAKAARWYSATEDLSSENALAQAIAGDARDADGTHHVTAPSGAKALAVTIYKSGTASVYGENVSRLSIIENEVSDLDDRVSTLENEVDAIADDIVDLDASQRTGSDITPISTQTSKYINASGNIVDGGAYDVEVYAVSQGDVIRLTFSGYGGIGSGAAKAARWYSATENLSSENALAQAIEGDARDVEDRPYHVTAPSGAKALAVTIYKSGTASVYGESVPKISVIENEIADLNDRVSALEGESHTPMTGSLNILVIGNSYSFDALAYLPSVMYLAAPDLSLTVGIAMDGSQTLQGHLAKINNDSDYTRFETLNRTVSGNDNWTAWPSDRDHGVYRNINTVLSAYNWDYIFFHEASAYSAGYSTVETYLPQLIAAIKAKGYNGEFGYIITPAFAEGTTSGNENKLAVASENAGLDHTMSSDEMSRRIVDVALNARKDNDLAMVLPCGIALQMARHTPLNRLGDWSPEDAAGGMMVYSDGHHLQMGIANFIESCAAAITLTNGALNLKPLTSNPRWPNGDRMAKVGTNNAHVYTGLDKESMEIGIQCARIAAADLAQLIQYAVNN